MQRGSRAAILGIFALEAFMFIVGGVKAAPYQDIPQALNEALLGGTSLYAAKLILSGGILASVGLSMSMTKVNFIATVIVMLVILAVLVAIDWMDFWLIIMVSLLVVAMFGSKVIIWMSGEQSGG